MYNKINCSICSQTENKCIQCNEDYYPNGTECHSCSSINCEICNSKTGVCSECLDGYYFLEGKCYPCDDNNPNNCQKEYCYRKEEKKCYSCKSGYYLNQETNICEKVTIPNCEESIDKERCIKCKEGYKLFKDKCYELECIEKENIIPTEKDTVCGEQCDNVLSQQPKCIERNINCYGMKYENETKKECLVCDFNYYLNE